jgi:hypothetical protein
MKQHGVRAKSIRYLDIRLIVIINYPVQFSMTVDHKHKDKRCHETYFVS